MKIHIVCGAGASSTFVAQRLRRAAADAGLDWETSAGTEQSLIAGVHDLILVGPHIAERLTAIQERVRVPVAVLPADVFADREGVRTLAIARSALNDDVATPKGTS